MPLPQKRQSLLSIRRCPSCWVSLPSLLSLEERSGLLLLEELEELVGGHLELFEEDLELLLFAPELLFKPELFFQFSDWLLGFADLSDFLALLELMALSWLILELHSQ